MLNFNKQFLTAMLIVASMTMSSCEKDVYEAPSTNDINVVAVTEAHGSAQNGWTVNGIAQGVYDLEFYTKSSSTSVQPYVKAG